MAKKICIGNLPSNIIDKKLSELFSTFGKVTSVVIVSGIGSTSGTSYGYVTMSDEEDAKKAIKALHNDVIDKQHIKVIEAHPIDQDGHSFAYKRFKSKKYR